MQKIRIERGGARFRLACEPRPQVEVEGL